jgi:hypothetical protein
VIKGEESKEMIKRYVKMQKTYERVGKLKDLKAAIEILSVNLLEHRDKRIY